jgi:uncharacterized membrane protein YebE (DUF533 family)
MFNPEKLLRGMLRASKRGRTTPGFGSLISGGTALGLVGVAIAAAEHFMKKPESIHQAGAPGTPPLPPGATAGAGPGSAPPPPPQLQSGAQIEPAPVQPTIEKFEPDCDAVLLIRAMIAAANADGIIDADERSNILGKLQEVDLSKEEHAFVVHELLAPKPVQDLVVQVKTAEMAQQVYAASLMAIKVDSEVERDYLRTLSHELKLDEQTLNDIHRQLGVPAL